jgi:hypothetical protein
MLGLLMMVQLKGVNNDWDWRLCFPIDSRADLDEVRLSEVVVMQDACECTCRVPPGTG